MDCSLTFWLRCWRMRTQILRMYSKLNIVCRTGIAALITCYCWTMTSSPVSGSGQRWHFVIPMFASDRKRESLSHETADFDYCVFRPEQNYHVILFFTCHLTWTAHKVTNDHCKAKREKESETRNGVRDKGRGRKWVLEFLFRVMIVVRRSPRGLCHKKKKKQLKRLTKMSSVQESADGEKLSL